MFRGKTRKLAILALTLMLAVLPAMAETTVEQRLDDLETLRAGLEEGHYDLFALVTPEEWQARLEETAEKLRDESLDDKMACYALIELVASLGDAHTQAWFTGGNAQGDMRALPLQTGLFDGGVYLLATTEPYAQYLGMEITAIEGVPNAIPLIKGILNSEFAAGPVHARWLEEEFLPGYEAPPSTTSHTEKQGRRSVVVEIDGQRHTMTMPADLFGQQPSQPRRTVTRSGLQTQATGEVVSPMQAMVVRVPVTAGQTVQEGELLVVLEAMKMEKYIHATLPGTISEVHVAEGNNVAAGAALVTIQPAEPTKENTNGN